MTRSGAVAKNGTGHMYAVCAVQAASQQRFVDMLRHREELTSAMTPPPARRPGAPYTSHRLIS